MVSRPAGKDLVAVDAICARLIGYSPREILLTVKAAARGLGIMDSDQIDQVGEPLENVKRRFLRSVEDSPVEVEGFQLIQDEATCTGCRNTVMSALIDMRNADQLMYLPGVTVVTGGALLPADVAKVCRIYENMGRVFEIADRDQIPTYLAADRMAEERIRQIAEVKKYVDDLKP